MNSLTVSLGALALLLATYSTAVEPPTEPKTGEPTTTKEDELPAIIESYTPDEAISEDNAIPLPSDI